MTITRIQLQRHGKGKDFFKHAKIQVHDLWHISKKKINYQPDDNEPFFLTFNFRVFGDTNNWGNNLKIIDVIFFRIFQGEVHILVPREAAVCYASNSRFYSYLKLEIVICFGSHSFTRSTSNRWTQFIFMLNPNLR